MTLLEENNIDVSRWQIIESGGIELKKVLSCHDHMAMSGFKIDMILEWAIDENKAFSTTKVIRWPMLSTVPDHTHSFLRYKTTNVPEILINNQKSTLGQVSKVRINGLLSVESQYPEGISVNRTIFPSVQSPAIIDFNVIKNNSDKHVNIQIPAWQLNQVPANTNGLFGEYKIREYVCGAGKFNLAPGSTLKYSVICCAEKDLDSPYYGYGAVELAARQAYLANLNEKLELVTPEPVLNQLFEFSKIRACESIFATRAGLMHSPGGYNNYLAAMWANDQAEYINPFFPFMGDVAGNQSAMNCFRLFARYMNPEYKPLPSSIIAEGRTQWRGVGDRGDMAMVAYGAARFALTSGNQEWSEELWPLITWCLDYLELKKNADGVIDSDSDELEGRFPCGSANLCTSTLYYDSLVSTAYLAKALNKESVKYEKHAKDLRQAIAKFFEAEVEGYDTYQYYQGNDILRSWICMPLTSDIFDKLEGTLAALFSERLWTKSGLLTQAGTKTVWDRSTLYALRGILASGQVEKGVAKLLEFSKTRLLGAHVPYVIEAYPEFNQSHLSAESGLYCRAFIEGLFGIRATGLHSFSCKPTVPKAWPEMSLNKIAAFGVQWNLKVIRKSDQMQEVIISDMSNKVIYDKILPAQEAHQISLDKYFKI